MQWSMFVAVVVGGILTYTAEWLAWRRRQHRRWDTPWLVTYQAFLAAVLGAHREWSVRNQSDTMTRLLEGGYPHR